jgi:hypothetical protein
MSENEKQKLSTLRLLGYMVQVTSIQDLTLSEKISFSVNTEHRLMRDTNCAVVCVQRLQRGLRGPHRGALHTRRCTGRTALPTSP